MLLFLITMPTKSNSETIFYKNNIMRLIVHIEKYRDMEMHLHTAPLIQNI